MKSGRLVVKHHSPWYKPAIFAGLTAVTLVGGWVLYSMGQNNAGFDSIAAMEDRESMRQAIVELERQKAELRDQIALAQQSKLVDKQAYEDVNSNIKALQEEILELREEVSFYRGIVSPDESSAGLHIERFRVEPTSTERLYHYKLVLTQVLKNDRTMRGSVKLYFEGVKDGQPTRIPLRSVSSDRVGSMDFRFRYFQKFEGDILLPEGFTPRSVSVEADPFRSKAIAKSFDWPDVQAGGEPSVAINNGLETSAVE